jgi:hypothetical protein
MSFVSGSIGCTMPIPRTVLKSAASFIAVGAFGLSTASAQTLLLQYTFDEPTGPALDYGAGLPAPATFEGGATRTTNTPAGYSAGALNASAANTYATSPDPDKLDGLSAFTLTGWMNLQAAPANGNRIMSKQVASGNFDGFSFAISNPSSGTIGAGNFRLNLGLGGTGGFGIFVSGANVSADAEWLFVAVSYDGAGGVNFYTGDAATAAGAIGSTLLAGAANPGTLVANDRDFRVAAQSEGTASAPIWLDDIRVYSGVLDATALDAVRLQNIPEPSTYAAIFGGLALLFAAARRFRGKRA